MSKTHVILHQLYDDVERTLLEMRATTNPTLIQRHSTETRDGFVKRASDRCRDQTLRRWETIDGSDATSNHRDVGEDVLYLACWPTLQPLAALRDRLHQYLNDVSR